MIYAHRLRHSAATAILAEGGSLAEVGQVLRHRRPHTTAAYTKVNVEGAARARPPMARRVVTGLREALAGYLDLRRGLGFKLERDAKLLDQFIAYLEQRRSGTITVADALAWATLPADASPGWLRMRITVVRGFAAYLATLDPTSPRCRPASLLPGGTRRAVPYLYSAADIAALLAQAEQLKTPLRRATIKTLIGLLTVTGMRRGEAIALSDQDFDARRRGCCWCATQARQAPADGARRRSPVVLSEFPHLAGGQTIWLAADFH